MYGGSTTSILVNIPGEAASVVTCLDGHQMTKQGRIPSPTDFKQYHALIVQGE